MALAKSASVFCPRRAAEGARMPSVSLGPRPFRNRLATRQIIADKIAHRNAEFSPNLCVGQIENLQTTHANPSDQSSYLKRRDAAALMVSKSFCPRCDFARRRIPNAEFASAMVAARSYRGISDIKKMTRRRTLMPEIAGQNSKASLH